MLGRLVLVLACSVMPFGGAYAQADAPPWKLQNIFQTIPIGAITVSPDGSRVAFITLEPRMKNQDSHWQANIHVAATNGTSSVRLTTEGLPATLGTSPEWSPDAKCITFIANGNLWRISASGGTAEQLTALSSPIVWHRWSPNGQRIAFLALDAVDRKAGEEKVDWVVVDRDARKIRLNVLDLPAKCDDKGPFQPRFVAEQNAAGNAGRMNIGAFFDWAPDSRTIAYAYQPERGTDYWTSQRIWIVDVDTNAKRPLRKPGGSAEQQPMFSPDGKRIAMVVSDTPPTWGFTRRVHVVNADGTGDVTLADTPDLQPSLIGWSSDGKRLLVSEVMRTTARVLALPVNRAPPVALGSPGTMVSGARLNATRTRIGFLSQSPSTPAEVFTANPRDMKPVRASNLHGSLPNTQVGTTDVMQWTSWDGMSIEGLITYPVGYREGTPVPLVVMVHGGPTEVWTRVFTGTADVPYAVATLAGRGYAVLRPNVRGSSGYGHAFRYANRGDWGGGDYRDILAGIDTLVAQGVVDTDRVAIMGGSYGGYLTAWAVTQTRRFKAAVVVAGITDLISNTGTTDVPGYVPGNLGGDFWEIPQLWMDRSPILQVARVNTPTLIMQGKDDPRVSVTQGLEFYSALRRIGVPAEMVIYPREAHGINQQPKFQCNALQRTLAWIDRYVMARETAAEDCTASP